MKYFTSFTLLSVAFVALIFDHNTQSVEATTEPFESVEIGIAELSPRGVAGGYAMPASGGSVELSFKQSGDQIWDSSGSAVFSEDRAVDLQWDGSGSLSNCTFTAGARVPGGSLAVDGTSLGSGYNRHLSLEGDSDTYTISCPDTDGNDTYTDTASLSLASGWGSTPECSDGYDNADTEDTLADASDPGCWTDPGKAWTYDPNDDDEGDGGYTPECADGLDNDGDTLVDYPNDPGCSGSNDDDEDDNSPTLTLTGCDSSNNCVNNGGTLKIDDSDEVTLSWTTTNVDFCDSVGSFSMPGGDTTSGTDVDVVEPDEGERHIQFMVACGNSGVVELAEAIYVDHPAIELIPYPNPPIVPSGGMPPGDPATVEPIIGGYKATLCYLDGAELSNPTIQTMIDDSRIVNGKYEVQLSAQGETTYVLTCYPDFDDDDVADPGGKPVTDTAIFRILPVIQET